MSSTPVADEIRQRSVRWDSRARLVAGKRAVAALIERQRFACGGRLETQYFAQQDQVIAARVRGASGFKLATAFFGVTVVALWIGVASWRMIGLL